MEPLGIIVVDRFRKGQPFAFWVFSQDTKGVSNSCVRVITVDLLTIPILFIAQFCSVLFDFVLSFLQDICGYEI